MPRKNTRTATNAFSGFVQNHMPKATVAKQQYAIKKNSWVVE